MSVEIDHVFICCAEGASEADALVRFGLTEGSPNVHPGQGTACRRFFFANAYLELMWVADPALAQSAGVRRTGLFDRWSQRDGRACPFALVLRPASASTPAPPFETWSYRPPYLPTGLAIDVASSAPLTDPAFFYLGFLRSNDRPREPPGTHAVSLNRLTGVEVHGPGVGRGAAATSVEAAGLARFVEAGGYNLVLGFDGRTRGSTADFRPALPLTIEW